MSFKKFFVRLTLAAATVASILLLIKNYKTYTPVQNRINNSPNLIITNGKLTAYTRQGLTKSILYTKQMTHFQKRNATAMVAPKIDFYASNQVSSQITANYGTVMNKTKIIKLWGNVILRQKEQENSPQITVMTTRLTYYPTKSLADTDQDVIIKSADGELHSHGMKADLKKGTLMTKSHTRGTFYEVNKKN